MKPIAAMVLGIATLLLATAAAAADSPVPNPDSLRAILPDAVDGTWVEVVPGTPGYIDGPVDYNVIRAYYTYYQQTDRFIQQSINILQQGGFVTGYQRQWFRPDTNDLLSELVYVFGTHPGALTVATTFQRGDAASQGGFDTTLGADTYGVIDTLGRGYNLTAVNFVRGNAYYDVTVGTDKQPQPAEVIAQARPLYHRAPSNIALSHTSGGSVLTRNIWLFAAAGLTLLLGVAILVAVATVALLFPHRRFVPRQGAPLST